LTEIPADEVSRVTSDEDPHLSSANAAERKRLAARRRFLLGGAAAAPVIVTFGPRQAYAAGRSVCASQLNFPAQGPTPTFVCNLFPRGN
jgi:hypothetical protein